MAKALSLSYCRVRYDKIIKIKRQCNFTHISMMKTRCCQEGNLPDFGSSVISEISQIDPDLDIGERLSNPMEIQNNIQARKLEHISIQKLAIKYNRLMKLSLEKQSLEQERKSLSQTIRSMIKEKEQKEEVEKSKEMARELRERHDTSVKSLQGIQNEVRLLAFGLPNVLNEKTPVDNEVILETHGSLELHEGSNSISHIDLAKKSDMIKFSSAGDRAFYFLGELAETQQNLLSYFSARITEHGFIPIVAPDFCKDFVIEGCGRRRDMAYRMQQPHVDKEIHYNVLGASEASFAAYLTKMTVPQKVLPLQLVSTGPSYDSVSVSKYPGLFTAAQTSKTNLFGVYSTLQDCYEKFEELQQLIVQLYKNFDVPIRLVLSPAHKLKLSEEIRAELQMWTPSLQEYLPVYGEVLDTTKLIAVLVEFGSTDRDSSYSLRVNMEVESTTSPEMSGERTLSSSYPQDDIHHRLMPEPQRVEFEVDIVQILLFLAALATRMWMLGHPRAVVFDELHFAKFAFLYMKRIFFFDVNPPLGKLLLALAGGYGGLGNNADFGHIGADFSPSFPVYVMRLLPAVLGSLVVPLVYQIAVELRLSRWAALLAGLCVVFDNAILVQSRFMLMEGMLLFFMCLSLYSYLKFRNLSHREFSVQWFFWLSLTGVSFACSLSIKYVGFFTAVLILMQVAKDYWKMLADVTKTDLGLVKHLFIRALFLLTVPIISYLFIFYIHLSLLTKAGPHDNIMTSAFQASLEGGLAALTKGQPLRIAFGSQITLRHTNSLSPGKPCWLHSHAHVYPIRYADGRGSSHQQQVTCYVFKDINNWWIIKHPDSNLLVVDEPPKPVKHGDLIQLVHGITSRALNSHDVAAPLTPQNQEVSCYIDYNISMPAQNLWKVEIVNRKSDNEAWQTINSHVRLHHMGTGQALKSTGKQLPDWGFSQLEVTTDRVTDQPATVWNVEEHRYTKSTDKESQTRDMAHAEMIPTEPTHLSFWTKFLELQYKMFMAKGDVEMEHKYSSEPIQWPFLSKNVAYWMSPHSNEQIHLIGNPVIWYSAFLSVMVYLGLFLLYLMRRQRGFFDLEEEDWTQFAFLGELLVGGYLLHYLPFFLTDRTLFLHSYLPCVVYKILVLAALTDHFYFLTNRVAYIPTVLTTLMLGLVIAMLWAFYKLSPFSYGSTSLKAEEILGLMWKDTWDFLIRASVSPPPQ
ncbi:protein O-mannosyl-transferase 1-like [Ostrea edulis]|uniref:protein O-mannosyl-transferase 1-like n=1 Tax=Ostrea edulis TaxID=37623 RepID=UPI0024AF283A|nr:protein O-mannosyl-transferase 1-like [Ostrea edulis]